MNEKLILKDGSYAYMFGKSITDNPYSNNTKEYNLWKEGFETERDYWEINDNYDIGRG